VIGPLAVETKPVLAYSGAIVIRIFADYFLRLCAGIIDGIILFKIGFVILADGKPVSDNPVAFIFSIRFGELSAFEHFGPDAAVKVMEDRRHKQAVDVRIYFAEFL
jgi:hypothetical protein